ncbi:MAG: hypothetical protein OXC11_13525 [Rhodospirillales bacterium]|nr:hypothetical protein [Rhodospirillales bacterium]
MADFVDFPESNHVWKGGFDTPGGDTVGDLPTHCSRDEGLVGSSISCWQLSEEELEEVQRTGKVWLWVWGQHPPVAVTGECPFVRPQEADE